MRHTLQAQLKKGMTGGYVVCAFLAVFLLPAVSHAAEPFAVPTFHSLGLYWTPSGGSVSRKVLVQYRPTGATAWKTGLPMKYNPISDSTADKADYRGSLVNLTPNTSYEVALTLEGTATTAQLTAHTWSEAFPIGSTVLVGSQSFPLSVTQSGSPGNYRVYDGRGATIDVANRADTNITINASHVIIRGFNLKGARKYGIHIVGGQDIIIENCDISNWGEVNWGGIFGTNYQGAIYSTNTSLKKLVVQRCKLHHPRTDANSWVETTCYAPNRCTRHPMGPQAIALANSAGNHVFRYNEAWSDSAHYFNDILGFGGNEDDSGFPGPDSDIYNNYLANAWDDGIEAEGGGQNVRIWNNYIDNTFMAIGNAAVTVGPLYAWRNVSGRSYSPSGGGAGFFLKMGYAFTDAKMRGHMYFFHNTLFQPNGEGFNALGGANRVIKHCVTRNNVLHVRSTSSNSISSRGLLEDVDFDYDLYNKTVPANSERNGIRGTPTYVSGAGFDTAKRLGNFQLASSSLGYDKGQVIPNFSDGYLGSAPDMGAHEAGSAAIQYGVKGTFIPEPEHSTLVPNPPVSFEVN